MLPDKFKNILLILMALLNIILIGLWWINRPGENRNISEKSSDAFPSKNDIVKLVTGKLHFDSSQRSTLNRELIRHFAWMDNYHQKENADRKILMENFTSVKPDSLLAIRYDDSLTHLRGQMGNEMFRHFSFIRNLCRPAQLPYFQSFMRSLADSTNRPENPAKKKSSFIFPLNRNKGYLSNVYPASFGIFLPQRIINLCISNYNLLHSYS